MTVIIIQLGVCSTLLCAQMVPESERDRPCAHAASPKAGGSLTAPFCLWASASPPGPEALPQKGVCIGRD